MLGFQKRSTSMNFGLFLNGIVILYIYKNKTEVEGPVAEILIHYFCRLLEGLLLSSTLPAQDNRMSRETPLCRGVCFVQAASQLQLVRTLETVETNNKLLSSYNFSQQHLYWAASPMWRGFFF